MQCRVGLCEIICICTKRGIDLYIFFYFICFTLSAHLIVRIAVRLTMAVKRKEQVIILFPSAFLSWNGNATATANELDSVICSECQFYIISPQIEIVLAFFRNKYESMEFPDGVNIENIILWNRTSRVQSIVPAPELKIFLILCNRNTKLAQILSFTMLSLFFVKVTHGIIFI